ncbi:Glu-tRNA(Gln) amidotransferase subunit GatD [Infirmifilum lucidum]|uniref:Glutamyl-tRNA(Gln) amidotransferase subunit D n=1 Tax=Infirmifilum lucidum TaxID=2776706 RepID=A0A7L9FFZ9_9CREN|nr:Glu-tRNA(Gln) amidotransferase subunit GatD [Infirmifilum lucidum]QOJ78272.1 Glu-tRNA(Gln) amidotransferase subunit GatD [Infirmifilum lucidum]
MESGYSQKLRDLLASSGVGIFDMVLVRLRDGVMLRGIILPRPQVGDQGSLVLKLDNGYNVGIAAERILEIKLLEKGARAQPLTEKTHSLRASGESVYFIGTGGTIASRVDYVTGAVYPYFSAEELYSMIPELEDIAVVTSETLFNIFSEDMTPQHWSTIARKIGEVYKLKAPSGIVVAHGTDTMHYSASAIAFAVHQAPGSIVFTGAQRSSDRPSSDSALNVVGAALTAVKAPFAESVIAMHGSVNDDILLVHRGVRARKMHTSRRDAFMSINSLPLARVDPFTREVKMLQSEYKTRSDSVEIYPDFSPKVALVKFYPGMDPSLLEFYREKGYTGLVIEGTGLGHINSNLVPTIGSLVRDGIIVVISSQCLWGSVNLNVYRTGVELLKAGAIPAGNMLPEVAYVKLSWVLGQTSDIEEAQKLFKTNIAYELSERDEYRHYPGAMGWW